MTPKEDKLEEDRICAALAREELVLDAERLQCNSVDSFDLDRGIGIRREARLVEIKMTIALMGSLHAVPVVQLAIAYANHADDIELMVMHAFAARRDHWDALFARNQKFQQDHLFKQAVNSWLAPLSAAILREAEQPVGLSQRDGNAMVLTFPPNFPLSGMTVFADKYKLHETETPMSVGRVILDLWGDAFETDECMDCVLDYAANPDGNFVLLSQHYMDWGLYRFHVQMKFLQFCSRFYPTWKTSENYNRFVSRRHALEAGNHVADLKAAVKLSTE